MGATGVGSSSTLYNVLKEFYLGPVQDQLNSEILLPQILPLSKENLEGRKAVLPLHSARSDGVGSAPESGTLPTAGNQSYKRAEYLLAYHYGRVEVTGQAIALTKSDSGSFVRAFDSELRRIKDDLGLDHARQMYGNGDALIANFAVNTAQTTLVLADWEALQKGFLYVNMTIDIGTAANFDSVASDRVITNVNILTQTTSTITISGAAVTTATTDFASRSKSQDGATTHYEMDAGIQKLVSTTAGVAVGGLDADTVGEGFWDNIRENIAGAISLSKLMENWNRVYAAGARSDGIVAITTPGIMRRLFETADFKSNVRFVNTKEMKGGFEEISFGAGSGTIRLVGDRLAPYGKVYLLDKQHIRLFQPNDWDFLARDGQPIKWVQDKDAWQAILFKYANLGTDRRNTSAVLYGVTDSGF